MEKNFKRFWWLFGLEFILLFMAFFMGGLNFVIENRKNLIMICLGFLTFVSVFMGFVYYGIGSMFKSSFKGKIEKEKGLVYEKIEKFVKEKRRSDKISELTNELSELESFGRSVNPEKWLFFSMFSLILTMISSLFDSKIIVPYIKINLDLVTAILFHISILFVGFLLISVFIWVWNYYKQRKSE